MAGILLKNFKFDLGLRFVHKLSIPNVEAHNKYRISLIHPESYEKGIAFMVKHFKDDPLTVALGANTSEDFPRLLNCAWGEDVRTGYSLQAVSTIDNIIGLSINAATSERENLTKMMDFAGKCNCYNTKNLIDAWRKLSKISLLIPFNKKTHGVFEISGVAVSNDYRGFGIAKQLISQSMCMAKCHGFEMARIDCTSEYSAQAAQSLGFQCVYEIPFEQFKGIKRVSQPHTHARVLVKVLDQFLT